MFLHYLCMIVADNILYFNPYCHFSVKLYTVVIVSSWVSDFSILYIRRSFNHSTNIAVAAIDVAVAYVVHLLQVHLFYKRVSAF